MTIDLAEIRRRYDRMQQLNDAVDRHNHGEFETCDVCKEGGLYDQSVRAYENAAINYVDNLMRDSRKAGAA